MTRYIHAHISTRYLAPTWDVTVLAGVQNYLERCYKLIFDVLVAAFALSSGTIGAALSSSLSKTRSIAISYGTVEKPTPKSYFEPAHDLGARIIRHLWENWGKDEGGIRNGEVDLYNVNIPMIAGLLEQPGLPIYWTRMWRNSYGRLFKPHKSAAVTSPAGPDSLDSTEEGILGVPPRDKNISQLTFKFSPEMGSLIDPRLSTVPVGSDGWAIAKGYVSVTPLRACFAEPGQAVHDKASETDIEESIWKVKL